MFKVTADKDGKLTVKVALTPEPEVKDAAHPLGIHPSELTSDAAKKDAIESNYIKVSKGTPYLTYKVQNVDGGEQKDIVLTSKTQFLVHQMDGSYVSYTGYKNVPSMIAHYAEVVYDSDYVDEKVASIVYLTLDVYTTDGKFIAYIGKAADVAGYELTIDGTEYFGMTAYVDGEATDVYVSNDDMHDIYSKNDHTFVPGFYQLQYTEVKGDKIVKTLKKTGEFTGDNKHLNIADEYTVVYNSGAELRINDTTGLEGIYELADGCKVYGIYDGKIVTDVDIDDVAKGDRVYFSVKDDDITALYVVIEK